MVDVPEHLAPVDGISDANIRLAGIDFPEDDDAIVRIEVMQGRMVIGAFRFAVDRQDRGNVDRMLGSAHRKMGDALRQMLHRNEVFRRAYET